MSFERVWRVVRIALSAAVIVAVAAPAIQAKEFDAPVKPGSDKSDVTALQVRIAGWYPSKSKVPFTIDGSYSTQTKAAMKAFEAAYGRRVNGIASTMDLQILNNLQGKNGATKHFDYHEFHQNRSSSCTSRANSYAGTFSGGMSTPGRVRRNVRRLMWRLEAVRKKGGSRPIGINSAFRSTPYNDCIGGARASQHLYGTAADNRMSGVDNRTERRIAKGSQFHGIGCYSSMTHNHFDLRIENKDLVGGHFWWWPRKDKQGRELADDGRPCWGEKARRASAGGAELALARTTGASVLRDMRLGVVGAGSLVPTLQEIELFETTGEAEDLGGLD